MHRTFRWRCVPHLPHSDISATGIQLMAVDDPQQVPRTRTLLAKKSQCSDLTSFRECLRRDEPWRDPGAQQQKLSQAHRGHLKNGWRTNSAFHL
jgi:hypothetical protein